MRYITQFLTQVSSLNVSNCWKITDAGLAQLSIAESRIAESLESLDVSRCGQVTNAGLAHLAKCRSLGRVSTAGSGITVDALKKFVADNKSLKLCGHVVERRMTGPRK